MGEEKLISTWDAARALGLSLRTVQSLISGGQLASVKILGRRLVRKSSVRHLMRNGVTPATSTRTLSRDYRGRFRRTPLTQVVGSYYKKPPDELQILLAHLRKIDPELGRELKKLNF